MISIIKKTKIKFSKQTMMLITLLAIALFSILAVSKIVTSPSFNAANIKSLDDKKVIVMKLAASAAASSTALSLLPGDVATPIANQIAELSSYFIVVLCAILLEKMLIAVVGYVSIYLYYSFCLYFRCFLFIQK